MLTRRHATKSNCCTRCKDLRSSLPTSFDCDCLKQRCYLRCFSSSVDGREPHRNNLTSRWLAGLQSIGPISPQSIGNFLGHTCCYLVVLPSHPWCIDGSAAEPRIMIWGSFLCCICVECPILPTRALTIGPYLRLLATNLHTLMPSFGSWSEFWSSSRQSFQGKLHHMQLWLLCFESASSSKYYGNPCHISAMSASRWESNF